MQLRSPLSVSVLLAVALVWLPGCTSEPDATTGTPAAAPPATPTVETAGDEQPPAVPEVAVAPDVVQLPEPAGPHADGFPPLPGPAPDESQPMASDEAKASWMTDFELAKAKAQVEGKDLFIDFTGSDWCTWCIRLDNEVFAYQPFYDFVDENFVLLKLDFPRGPGVITEEQLGHNNAIKEHYGSVVEGFPTILLTDATGRAYAKTGFEFGGPVAYVQHLTGLQEVRAARDTAFTAAAELQGADKAKKLEEGLLAMAPPMFLPSYEAEIDQIIELDADNAAGLNEKYTDLRRDHQFSKRVSAIEALANSGELSEIHEEVLKAIDQLAADYPKHESGLEMISSFRIVVLRAAERFDDAVAYADSLLAKEDLSQEYRSNILNQKLGTFVEAKRLEEAIPTMDALILTTDNPNQKTEMLVVKATWQAELKQVAAAKATFELARETGGPEVWDQIDAYEARIMAKAAEPEPEVTPPEPTVGPEPTPTPQPSTPAPASPAPASPEPAKPAAE